MYLTELYALRQVGLVLAVAALLSHKSFFSLVGLDNTSANCSNCSSVFPFPSTASLINEIVLSILRRLVLGLVIVVPKLACLECPRRGVVNGEGAIAVGVLGDTPPLPFVSPPSGADDDVIEPLRTAASRAAVIPLGVGTGFISSSGVAGVDKCGAASSGSTSSGGKRSFSISDLRLDDYSEEDRA